MAVQQEIWRADIEENLYKGNEFMKLSVSHDDNVDFKTVHFAQAGATPSIVIDRSSFPATITQRTDTDRSYSLQSFSTNPVNVTLTEEAQAAYDKRMEIFGEHINVLKQTIGDKTIYNWTPTGTAYQVRTTGASGSSLAPSATGTRKMITLADIASAASLLDLQLVPRDERVLLIPSQMFWELMSISEIVRASYNGFQNNPNVLATGQVAELYNFKVVPRPSVNVFQGNTASDISMGAGSYTAGATDCLGALAYHPKFVAKAQGETKIYMDSGDNGNGNPAYYGTILSAEVLMGSTYLRTDKVGMISIVQQG